jgi:hypothetical protein
MTMLNFPGGLKSPQYNGLNYPVQTVEYLVVAGGAGGLSGFGQVYAQGGSGAGGLLTATGYPITLGSSITITVGAGGASAGYNGNNSVFGNITAIGGGGGGGSPGSPASSGGSGGGQDDSSTTSLGKGIPGQGNNGGIGNYYSAGGGGGAGSIGINGDTNTGNGGNGGTGIVSSITGSPVQYAGGGGAGGTYYYAGSLGGLGGGGGGGNGGNNIAGQTNGTSGLVNTGGGGGSVASTGGSGQTGGIGGSGIVVIRYPSYLAKASATTGSPTTYIAGPYRVYVFYASGTITF